MESMQKYNPSFTVYHGTNTDFFDKNDIKELKNYSKSPGGNNMTEETSKAQLDQIQKDLNEVKDLLYRYLEKKKSKSRNPSIYNKFVGKCRREGKDMKECGQEWRELKESGQEPKTEEDL